MSHRARGLILILALACPVSAAAQQVGESINVLPVYKSTPPGELPGPYDYIKGDLYGQRQNEPTIAVSTLNKDHIVAFYNDWRWVDVPDDAMIPGTTASTLARLWNGIRGVLAKLTGIPGPGHPQPDRRAQAPSRDAGIGMSVSYDGGLTWTGGFVPGMLLDTSPASLASPAYGMQGMSDPVVVAAPCGRFYLAYLAFTRDQQSRLVVSALQDLNNDDLRHTIRWGKTTLIEQGNNGTWGHFLDKPHMAIGLTGASSCDQVTERVYVSYTTFTGLGTGGKFQSKINLATSIDGGKTFTVSKVDDSFTQSQGTAVVVNQVTKDVYVFWRSFNAPNTIVMSKTTRTGWSKPKDLLATDTVKTLATFDQPSVTTLEAGIADNIAFRTNAFPTAAFTPDGSTVLVAWQERIGTLSGLPDPMGPPRIVLKYSKDGGATWTPRIVVATTHLTSLPGLGFFNPGFFVGPQVMPSLSCGSGNPNRCLLTYYESRPYGVGSNVWQESPLPPVFPFLSPNGWIGGYNRVLDLRAVVIDAPKGAVTINESFQVSRYAYRPLDEGERPGEDYSYVSQICPPPDGLCYPSLDFSGDPHTSNGTMAFMGDYNDVQPMVSYVKDAATGAWRVASSAADAPYGTAFIAAWADNRNLVRPRPADGSEWTKFSEYGAPGKGGSCVNPGSRDQSVMSAQISLGLLVTAPTNYKPFVAPKIEFPMTVWNNTAADKQFQLDVASGAGSFSKGDSTYQQAFVKIYAYSSSTVNVYVWSDSPVKVNVTDLSPAGLTGAISFNSPQSVPQAGTPSPTYTAPAIVVNPGPRNPGPRNAAPQNPGPRNTLPDNTTVYKVIDYSWTVDPSTIGDPSTYVALANVDLAYQNDYKFQLFITKPATAFTASNVNGKCEPANLMLGTLVANISDPDNILAKNPGPRNPIPTNPGPRNPAPLDIIAQNATFTLGSNTTAGTSAMAVTASGTTDCDPITGGGLIGDCTMAAPRPANQVTITVRAYQVTVTPAVIYDPYGDDPRGTGTPNPPGVTVADYWCDGPNKPNNCTYIQDGPDLVAPASADATPRTVRAGDTVTFPTEPQTVPNAGNRPALAHEVGFYISAASTVASLPRNADGTINTSSSVYTRQLKSVTLGPLGGKLETPAPSLPTEEIVIPQMLTIPVDIPRNADGTGTPYYLYAYVDSMRVVSELNEDNNIIEGGEIIVLAPGYGFLGLQTPCSGYTCSKTGTMPLAWQFTNGSVAVDSVANLPRLKFWRGCGKDLPVDAQGYPANPWPPLPPLGGVSEPDPADLTSGKSGWQYFLNAGMVRPQYTWQFNFDATGLPRGYCYTMWIEIPSTQQVVTPPNPALKPFGPFSIKPR